LEFIMNFSKLFAMLALFSCGYSWAQSDIIQIDEKVLKAQISDNVPEIQKIQAAFQQAAYNDFSARDKLAPELYGGFNHETTNERPIIAFMPVWSPTNQYQVGLRKNFRFGVQADLNASIDQRSANVAGLSGGSTQYRDMTTMIYSFNLSLDLWKDLFGKMTQASLESADLARKNAKLQMEIQKKAFHVALRRVYWSLVANNEKILISQELLKTAQKQAKDARKRKANNIADEGEVARYESQVYARKGSLLYQEYERERYLKQLRTLLPELTNKKVALSKYDLGKTVFQVLECTQVISSQQSTPYNFTQYDEMSRLIKGIQSNQKIVDESYDKIDVKLSANFRSTGVGSEEETSSLYEGSIGLAQEDMADNDRSGFAAGLMVNIPLGNPKKRTTDAKMLYNQKKLEAQRMEIDNNLQSTHKQISRQVNLLTQVIQAQRANSEKLGIRLKDMRKKYSQARISVTALIQDQDAKMNSDLAIIDTQLAVVNTLLDYLVVFNDTPCSFNRI
jgi:outer membrane protein TolC